MTSQSATMSTPRGTIEAYPHEDDRSSPAAAPSSAMRPRPRPRSATSANLPSGRGATPEGLRYERRSLGGMRRD